MIARRPGPTVRRRVQESTGGGERHREDRIATEEPLELRLAWPGMPPERIWVTMRTPGNDFDLAAGYVVHEGLADHRSIGRVAYCTDSDLSDEQQFNVVTVTLTREPPRMPASRHAGFGAGSACGVCGKDSVSAVLDVPRSVPWTGERIAPEVVRVLPERLRSAQPVFARTGGVHGAALATARGDLLVVREDIGRHNSVDKVTGARVLAGEPPAEAVLVVSGRASFELVQKAVTAGIGTLVAVGAPSSLAVRLAVDAGLELFGFTSADRCVRYC